MECIVCYENTDGYVTSCRHSVCIKCMRRLTKPICPMCRRVLIFPKNSKSRQRNCYEETYDDDYYTDYE